jgi:hypothetical protein
VRAELQGPDSIPICWNGGAYRKRELRDFREVSGIRVAFVYRMDRMAVAPPVP